MKILHGYYCEFKTEDERDILRKLAEGFELYEHSKFQKIFAIDSIAGFPEGNGWESYYIKVSFSKMCSILVNSVYDKKIGTILVQPDFIIAKSNKITYDQVKQIVTQMKGLK